MIRMPRVRMIRQPPTAVPSAIANPAERITHNGGDEPCGRVPAVINVKVMMPIVFCASLVPWARETIEAETIWPTLNPCPTSLCRARSVIR